LRRHEVDTGHWLPLKRPDWLAQRIDEFVRFTDGADKESNPRSR